MQPYQSLNEIELLELLAEYTALYTKLLSDKNDDGEFSVCREILNDLMNEIETRKKTEGSYQSTTKKSL